MVAEASELCEGDAVLVLPEILGYDHPGTPAMIILLWLLAGAPVIVGLAGVVLPGLPGHLLILAGLVLGHGPTASRGSGCRRSPSSALWRWRAT
jgi:hypothetical protein